ncbi:hypothetical protein F2Q70_00021856 [Brassica cretica]|uniref:Uncharacterized protein n=1 Tax=Brassica cretica TaxID=69181 RepID=A0A8S9GWQ7_BRACR|nr:hypothetical protein F2Q70_00021856 [Brassica cretica]
MVMGWDRVRNGPQRIGRLPGEPIHGTIEQADRQHDRARRRVDRRHGGARRASWPVSRPSSVHIQMMQQILWKLIGFLWEEP